MIDKIKIEVLKDFIIWQYQFFDRIRSIFTIGAVVFALSKQIYFQQTLIYL